MANNDQSIDNPYGTRLNSDTQESPNGVARRVMLRQERAGGAGHKGLRGEIGEAGRAIRSAASEAGDVLHEISPITVGRRVRSKARSEIDRLRAAAAAALREGKRAYRGEPVKAEVKNGQK